MAAGGRIRGQAQVAGSVRREALRADDGQTAGRIAPTTRLAAFRKLLAVSTGPDGVTVRLNVTVYPGIEAVTVAAPGWIPLAR